MEQVSGPDARNDAKRGGTGGRCTTLERDADADVQLWESAGGVSVERDQSGERDGDVHL